MKPLISVIIPTYQHASALPACVEAVFAQTYPNLEIIVVDDGSTDNTQEILKKYQDRVKSIHQDNQGSNPARNRGLQEAKGEFVICCDADVIMKPQMLEKMYQALVSRPEASYAYASFWFGWKHFAGQEFDGEKLRQTNFIHTSSLARKADFPGFDDKVKRLQDWDVWLTMLAQGKRGVWVPETLFTVSIHGASRIGSSWLPKIFYRIPWKKLGWTPRRIKKYEAAKDVIVKKHQLVG